MVLFGIFLPRVWWSADDVLGPFRQIARNPFEFPIYKSSDVLRKAIIGSIVKQPEFVSD
jgi:hypothetical protein